MGNVRKIGDEYYIEFYAKGLLYQQKAGPDKAKAKKLLRDTEQRIEQGEMRTIERDVDVDVFFQKFEEEHRRVHPPLSWARYEKILSGFQSFLKKKCPQVEKLSQITPPVMEQHREYLLTHVPKVLPDEINLNILLIRDALEYGIKLGYINDNPTLHTRFVATSRLINEFVLSMDEVDDLLVQASDDLTWMITIITKTGLRLEEALCLTWSDVDFNEGCLRVAWLSGSCQRIRRVPMDRNVQQIFKKASQPKGLVLESLAGHALESTTLQAGFKALVKRAGFSSELTLDSLRHIFAHSVVQKGATLVKVYHLLGMDDIAEITGYIRFLPKHII